MHPPHPVLELSRDEADDLAWGAYSHGRIDDARQWLALAESHGPMGLRVQSKIFLHDGHGNEAMTIPNGQAEKFSTVP